MQEKPKKMLAVAVIFCVVLSIGAAALFAKTSSSDTTLYVNPAKIEDPTILPGDTIVIRIAIDSVIDMKVCQFNLTFSPSILSVYGVTKLQVQGQYPNMNTDIDDVAGYLWVKLSYRTALTISANTSLVEIEFYVKGYGTTLLHFDSSTLQNSFNDPIPHETSDGFVHIFMRNIAVEDISISYSETYAGRIIPINVTVLNDGDVHENFSVSLFYDTTLISTQDVPDLPPKENQTLTFNWDTTAVSPRATPYTIKANATILPHETNITDNTLVDGTVKIKILGDVNGDNKVDVDDLIAWDAAYPSQLGDPKWNEQADINMDNAVDKADAQIILDHYKETAPP